MALNNSCNAPFPLVVAQGGTGAATFTAYSVICAGTTSTGAFQNVVGLGTSGYVLTSAGASALPVWAAPTAGLAYVDQSTSTVTLAANKNYGISDASAVTLTMPSTMAVGSVIKITGYGAGGWTMNLAGGQSAQVGNLTGTTSIASTLAGDIITMTCIVANTDFAVEVNQGNVNVT